MNGSEPPGEFSVSGVDLAADAVIVLGFGGPEGPDEVWPFLERVAAGRGIPRERLAAVAEHYQRFGGISPINGHNRDLTAALTAGLRDRGIEIPVVLAHRNTPPYAADALTSLTGAGADGDQTIVALATSAYPSYSGCRQYREDLGQGLVDAGLSGDTRVTVRKIPPFFALDGVSTAATELVLDGLDRARAGGAANPVVLFTTHSLPSGGARASGPAAGPTDIGGRSQMPTPRPIWPSPPRSWDAPGPRRRGGWSTSRAVGRRRSPGSDRTSSTSSPTCAPTATTRSSSCRSASSATTSKSSRISMSRPPSVPPSTG
ncbi:MAG: ferrochelatase [Dermatophilaceae bacterium]